MTDTFWKDAAKGGLIIGGISAAAALVLMWLFMSESSLGSLVQLLEFLAVAYFLYRICRRRSMLFDARTGYSYGKNMSFVMAIMLFAGFIYGTAGYFCVNFVFPGYIDEAINRIPHLMYEMDGDTLDMVSRIIHNLFSNPIFMIFGGIVSMVFYGGIIGLIVSIFVKRKPDIFAGGQ